LCFFFNDTASSEIYTLSLHDALPISHMRFASYPSLEDRVAFVTGGGSGIGASVVEHLCAQRARVTFVDIQREVSEALVARVAARGLPAPSFIACDLRDIAVLRAAVAAAEARLGPIRVLVNNAAHDERH